MHTIKYSLFPNNEIRAVHYYRAPQKEAQPCDEGVTDTCPEILVAASPEGECVADSFDPLDISSDLSKRSGSAPRKRTKFGINAKRTLLRMGGAFDTVDSNPQNYVFLTGTIPGGTHEAFQAMAQESLFVVRRIADWLQKTAPSDYWFYCWELQKRGALHIHYCIHPNDSAACEKILQQWKPKWSDILDKVGHRRAVDMWLRKDGTHHREGKGVLQAYAQRVHTSVAAYMSGYLAGGKDKHSGDADSPYFPSRWWGASRKATNLLKSLTEEVVVSHTNFRDARNEIEKHYERVLHDSPKAHHYPHKVGIGSTVVSYHPEDKGHSIWQPLRQMLYLPQKHPDTSYSIQLYRRLVQETIYLLEASPRSLSNCLEPLLTMLRGLCFPGASRGYGITRRDMTVILTIDCTLNSPLCTAQEWEKLRLNWWHLQDTVKERGTRLKWDVHGNLANYEDVLRLLDEHPSLRYRSTTDPKGEAATGEAANGSLSPQTSPSTGSQLWLFSDS